MSVTSLVYEDTQILGPTSVDFFGDGSGIALYRFDGNANDESGNYHGTETSVTYGGGQYGRGARLATLGTSQILLPIPATNFVATSRSVSLWVNMQSLVAESAAGSYAFVVCDGGWSIAVNSTGIGFTVFNGSTAYNASNAVVPSLNTWYHIVAVKDTVNGMKLYINGVLSGTNAFTGAMNPLTYTSVGFGAYNQYANRKGFTGVIDQARIFNRAITATEVAVLYAEAEPTSIVDNINPFEDGSLKALYQFDGDATDKTGVYNGTATNVTYGTGKFGQCAVFNGTSSNVLIPAIFSGYTGNLSFSIWFKTTINDANLRTIIYPNAASSGAYLYLINGNVRVAWSLLDAGGYYDIPVIVSDGNFHNMTIVFANNYGKMYSFLDGNLKHTQSYTANKTLNMFTAPRYIGTVDNSIRFWNGSIDQLRIFNKALTPMEVASLYNETTPLEEPLSAQVDPFKDGSGKMLYRFEGNTLDESGNYPGTATSIAYASSMLGGRNAIFSNSRSTTTPTSYIRFSTIPLTDFTYTFWLTKSVTGTHGVAGKFVATWTNRILISNDITFGVNGISYISESNFTDDTNTHFYTISRQGTLLKFYRDGVFLDGLTVSSAVSDIDVIGCYVNTTTNTHLAGKVDQFRKFNRALTDAEITQLYNAGA